MGIASDHFCVGRSAVGKASCIGDSGGPFLMRSPTGPPMVVGVVSYGPAVECGDKRNFDVATSVSYWRTWMDAMIAKYRMNG
jgi:secreted trypsin-like serine protease